MSKTRNNHYVPQWYQEGFFQDGRRTLSYLDLHPPKTTLENGKVFTAKALFDAPTSRAFCQRDLYSTFFGTSVSDEIERRLFGDIDTKGSQAVRAFYGKDVGDWHRHFQTFFAYIDIQKLRTPKGLDWLRDQYPKLTQNDLMLEMQGIRQMHCTIWTEGVREIVSAENSDVKFIISDQPVTVYNHATSPEHRICAYPNDPSIALKGSQTIFPLNQNFCIIFSNLEYARDPSVNPLEKRTFARNFGRSMTRTDAFIRTRKLSEQEITGINYIIKSRARRYIAAGRNDWLFPERSTSTRWEALRTILLPSSKELFHFGGEMFAKFKSGDVHYQDEFGRTEKERDFLKKKILDTPLRSGGNCGCGSGHRFSECCKSRPIHLRPSWMERSVRERNLMLQNGIINVLGLKENRDWLTVRRELTDDKISKVYSLYEGLWPLETNLLSLLPKPDGFPRAVYTGSIHPSAITDFALGASLYFGELIVEHPFLHAGIVNKKYSPIENPRAHRQDFLKAVVFFFKIMPLVELGIVNLIPDPCCFDPHLREQTWAMAKLRTADMSTDLKADPRMERLMRDDFQRSIMSMPRSFMLSQIQKAFPAPQGTTPEKLIEYIENLREADPLAVMQEDTFIGGKGGGQLNTMTLAPNFEIAMYLAQATGASIVTDSPFRWKELQRTSFRRNEPPTNALVGLTRSIENASFSFPQDITDIISLSLSGIFSSYPQLFRDSFKYLMNLDGRGSKPNREAQLMSRFTNAHSLAQRKIHRAAIDTKEATVSCAFLHGGIRDNTVNRLLLMSSSDQHLLNVPMAFFIKGIPPN